MQLYDQIRAVLDRAEYFDLFVEKPTEQVVNERLKANKVAASVTDIRKHPEGGFLIRFIGVDGAKGELRHIGWER